MAWLSRMARIRQLLQDLWPFGASQDEAVAQMESPQQRLYSGACGNAPHVIERAIADGAVLDEGGGNGLNALQIAAAEGNPAAFECLLQHGADIRVTGRHPTPAIELALASGHAGAADIALSALGTPAYQRLSRIPTAWLMLAAQLQDSRPLQTLLVMAGDVDALDEAAHDLLYAAAQAGHGRNCLLLVRAGMPLNEHNHRGLTPLHLAAIHAHTHCASYLVALGASTRGVVSADGYCDAIIESPPLVAAVHSADIELLTEALSRLSFYDKKEFEQAFGLASDLGLEHMAQMLRNVLDRWENRLELIMPPLERLICAASRDSTAEVEAALREGAPIDEPGVQGVNALQMAAAFGATQAFELLLQRGADVHAPSCRDKPIVELVLPTGKSDLFVLAAEAGALCATIPTRWLFEAAKLQDPRPLEMLLAHDGDVLVLNDEGQGLLHAAAEHGSYANCVRLVRAGLDINARDRRGLTPLHLAAAVVPVSESMSCDACICLLVALGADTRGVISPIMASDRLVDSPALCAAVHSRDPELLAEALARRGDSDSLADLDKALDLASELALDDMVCVLRSAIAHRHAHDALADAVAHAFVP